MGELTELIRERASKVQDSMRRAERRANRPAESCRLVVVTKRHCRETIQAAIEAGLSVFGENYPEEAVSKMHWFKEQSSLHWEMIGHIQSRKADLVAHGFDLIHSMDSLKLATRVDRFRGQSEGIQKVLLEINIAAELNKSGFRIDNESTRDQFFKELEAIAKLENLKICGLMGMPPLQDNPEANRVYFAALKKLLDNINARYDWNLHELSMGTSTDFEVAIEEGATIIRVGEAILGKRN